MNNASNNIDLNQFDKIEDIIYLDEPILTHLIKNNKNYLQYLVDSLDNSDIYLLIETEEIHIYEYLTGQLSLKKLISNNKNYIFLIEQDFNGNVINTEITQSHLIPENYFPTENSFLNYEPTTDSYYYNFIKDQESKAYLNYLRTEAFYIKLSPKNKRYSDTIGFIELVNELLKNISFSYKSFLKADFFESFKELYVEKSTLNTIFRKIEADLDYRMVDLDYGSFEIGLAVDKIMKESIENLKIRKWATEIGFKYKNTVLDDEFDDQDIENIVNKYSIEDRKRIFEPIFKISENSNFTFKIKDSKENKYSNIMIGNKSKINKILPKRFEEEGLSKSKEYEIIQITTIKEKDKPRKSIKIGENSLFESSDAKNVMIRSKDFKNFGFEVDENIEIPLNISTDKGQIIFDAIYKDEEFRKVLDSGKFDEGMKKIISSIYEFMLNQPE